MNKWVTRVITLSKAVFIGWVSSILGVLMITLSLFLKLIDSTLIKYPLRILFFISFCFLIGMLNKYLIYKFFPPTEFFP